MTFSYYPGCTLKTKAKDLNRYAYKCAEVLGFELAELPEWQCCGGTYPMATDETATKLSSVRALASARDLENENIIMKANNYLKLEEPYHGETNVIHYLEVLRDRIGFDEVAKKVVNPLKGKKVAAYYGCLLLRPGKVLQMDNPENPRIMEDLIRAMGAEPVLYPYRNECCGGYLTMEDRALAQKKSNTVMGSAKDFGADLMITACPLCLYNLKKNATEYDVPVVYFTELLAEALGVKED